MSFFSSIARRIRPTHTQQQQVIIQEDHQVGRWDVWLTKFVGFDYRYALYVSDSEVVIHPPRFEVVRLAEDKKNLLTNAGRDWMHAQVYTNTSAGTRGAGYLAVTTDSGAPAAGDTTLATEITTGGLGRADAGTKTHTGGTNSTTVAHTFTASAQHTAVQKGALFNASSSGTMAHENTFTSASLEINDTLTVTATLNLG